MVSKNFPRDIRSPRDFNEFLRHFGLDDREINGLDVKYDGSNTGLEATTIQEAIDEVAVAKIPFNKDTVSPLTLKSLIPGHVIRSIAIRVDSEFDGGYFIKVGFPAENDEMVKLGEVDLTGKDVYVFDYYRISVINETLKAYFSGSSTQGIGYIFVW